MTDLFHATPGPTPVLISVPHAGTRVPLEIAARRVERYWRSYRDRIRQELVALKTRFGIAALWEAHSIPAEVPRFLNGRLPDLNLGSVPGASASAGLVKEVRTVLKAADRLSTVVDGRFTGGYITRHFGRRVDDMHALQLEIVKIAYMDEAPRNRFDPERATALKGVLMRTMSTLIDWARAAARVGA